MLALSVCVQPTARFRLRAFCVVGMSGGLNGDAPSVGPSGSRQNRKFATVTRAEDLSLVAETVIDADVQLIARVRRMALLM